MVTATAYNNWEAQFRFDPKYDLLPDDLHPIIEEEPTGLDLTLPASRYPAGAILSQQGFDHSHIAEDGQWHDNNECPKCSETKFSVVKNPNGTGGWLCHNPACQWKHEEGTICSYANYAQETEQEYHDDQKLDFKDVVPFDCAAFYYPELADLAEGSISVGIALSWLAFLASTKGWVAIPVRDKTLMARRALTEREIRRLKVLLRKDATIWADVQHKDKNVTYYLFHPGLMRKALMRQADTVDKTVGD